MSRIRRPAPIILLSIHVAVATALGWSACSYADENDCRGPFKNHGAYLACESRRADQVHLMLLHALAQALRCAQAYHSYGNPDVTADIRSAQANWDRYAADQCVLEGTVGGGASAPEPGSDVCMQRLGNNRTRELESLCQTLSGN